MLLGLIFLVGGILIGPAIWIAALVYVVGACVVTGVRRWTRLGGGLLLAIGLWILIGAGVCVAQLASGRSVL
ncbi:hypothetical protein [Sinomonas sp. G460-2]|uniref:hypothetical protein n=1 Tax=Sinomonas sp. G460-2 TaxID=3393464 RepID=UPI0039EE5186